MFFNIFPNVETVAGKVPKTPMEKKWPLKPTIWGKFQF